MTLLDQVRAKIADLESTGVIASTGDEADLETLRDQKLRDLESVVSRAERDGRELLADEKRAVDRARSELRTIDEELRGVQLRGLREREAELADVESRRDAVRQTEERLGIPPRPAHVVSEARTYTGGSGSPSLLRDMLTAERGDYAARDRLIRHANESRVEQRAIGTGAVSGLVVPQYLTDQFAEYARAGRPFANVVRSMPLPPEGMTVNISRVTTGSTADVQATENSAVSETDIDDTLLTIDVRTIAGQQSVSRQAVERGTNVDEMILADLARAYATRLDWQTINGDGTSGTHRGVRNTSGINTVTYTDASPTVGELYPKIADAISQVNTTLFLPPTVIVMHPRRWAWFTAALDTVGRPLVEPDANVPQNAIAVGAAAATGGVVGALHGVPVVTDANIPTNVGAGTNEDIILVARADELVLWEDTAGAPVQLRLEDVGASTLTVKFVAYGYSAFTAGRQPKAVAIITGTGLVTPAF